MASKNRINKYILGYEIHVDIDFINIASSFEEKDSILYIVNFSTDSSCITQLVFDNFILPEGSTYLLCDTDFLPVNSKYELDVSKNILTVSNIPFITHKSLSDFLFIVKVPSKNNKHIYLHINKLFMLFSEKKGSKTENNTTQIISL